MSRSTAGFTLMEVVVAMAILSVSAVLLLESHYATLDLTAEAQSVATANRLLEAAVSYAQIQTIAGETRGDGEFGELYPGYSYAFTADEVDHDQRSGLYQVEVVFTTPTEAVEHTFFVYVDALAQGDEISLD